MAVMNRPLAWADIHAVRAARHLLSGSPFTSPQPVAVAARVAGLHAQVDGVPRLSVLARTRAAAPGRPDDDNGWPALVRTWAMRGTVHLVPAAEAHLYAAALGDSVAASQTRLWPKHGVPADAAETLNDALVDAVAPGPVDRHELARRVGERLGDAYRALLDHPWGIGLKPAVARGLLRLVGSGPGMLVARPDALMRDPDPAGTPARAARRWLARKYLDVNVAGTASSFAAWSGLPAAQARAAIEAVAEGSVTVGGRAYLTVGPLDARAGTGEVTLLPSFDPYTMAVVDRDGFCPAGTASLVYRPGAWISALVLRGGMPVGVWKLAGQRTKRVECTPFERLDAATARAVAAQAERVEAEIARNR